MYERYYAKHGVDRNDLLANPEVTFQAFAFDRANIRALQQTSLDRETATVLDVGCGTGASLLQFIRLGFRPENLSGVDNGEERIALARKQFPSVSFRCESAEQMSFTDNSFDVAFESTLFMMLTSENVAQRIASEMLRVTRPGGYIMLADWRYSRPGSEDHRAMTPSRIASLFGVGGQTSVVTRERGALVPPLGRFLSRRLPSLYFVVQGMLPFAVGQITTVLQKL
ncbi:MAG TPA: class I SAM-dependent methyltransferase [Gemmatimonadaceae bacterium]|nr:class I SAM-dependent methyltransferase [Gemmatimonadaceae bacterium]